MKFKNFFTLNRNRNDGGFTLVELIVVIAILAILGGVAMPIYSGYITKAERAADDELLASLNTAFAAACAMNGQDHHGRTDASASMTNVADGREASVDVSGITTFADDFAGFYEGGVFKAYVQLSYNGTKGVFEGKDEGEVLAAVKALLAASNYNGHLEEMTEDVGTLINVLADYLGQGGIEDIEGSGFGDYLTDVLGMSEADKADPNKMANAAVLYLAHSAANMTDAQYVSAKNKVATNMYKFVTRPGSVDLQDLVNDVAKDTGSGLASYAMLYATAEGLALQQGTGSDAYKNLQAANKNNPAEVLEAVGQVFNTVDKTTASAYFDIGGNFDKDMDAYFETMQAVNTKEGQLKNELDQGGLLTENETVKDMIGDLQS